MLLMELSARCAECGAAYPGNFAIEADTPPPFAWAHEAKKTVCSCKPAWPQLMVMVDGQWHLGYPGTDGDWTVDGAEERAFCRKCGAYFLGHLVVDPDDTSHLVDPDEA
ncbi:hypothetical protein [Phytohabitans kaempferiae]|uniref:CENP-V/GFA domain-containing protein n=1 Tax=Phytohabitans kaempferiae TaxID=1620943 RepID=A0ABV6LWF8_9ACTN